jgi:hypothetical protein
VQFLLLSFEFLNIHQLAGISLSATFFTGIHLLASHRTASKTAVLGCEEKKAAVSWGELHGDTKTCSQDPLHCQSLKIESESILG